MDECNEKSTAYRAVTFRDKDGVAQAPSSASYRIDCMTSGTAIRAVTALTPAATIEIVLTPTDNAIQNQGNPRERRRLTVTGVYGASDQVIEQFDHDVVNLTFAP